MGKIGKLFAFIKETGVSFSVVYEKEYGTYLLTMEGGVDGKCESYCHVYPDEIDSVVPVILEKMLFGLLLEKGGL